MGVGPRGWERLPDGWKIREATLWIILLIVAGSVVAAFF
jgi:hypothetical protein